jgi:hypothetical protein
MPRCRCCGGSRGRAGSAACTSLSQNYLREHYAEIKQGAPEMSHMQVMREASQRWSQLTSEAKQGYCRSEKQQTLSNEFIN